MTLWTLVGLADGEHHCIIQMHYECIICSKHQYTVVYVCWINVRVCNELVPACSVCNCHVWFKHYPVKICTQCMKVNSAHSTVQRSILTEILKHSWSVANQSGRTSAKHSLSLNTLSSLSPHLLCELIHPFRFIAFRMNASGWLSKSQIVVVFKNYDGQVVID